jgi:Domain of unknown function (DUF5134)
MSAPAWLAAALVALMIATALFHLGRMVATRRLRCPHQYDVDAAHALMGAAMVVMLVEPRAADVLGRLALAVAVPTVWFGCQSVRRYVVDGVRAAGQPARQALVSAAMLYMLVLAAARPASSSGLPSAAMAGMSMPATSGSVGGIGMRIVPLVMLGIAALVVWTAAQAWGTVKVRRPAGPAGEVLAPALSNCCQLAMTVTSGYLLVAML